MSDREGTVGPKYGLTADWYFDGTLVYLEHDQYVTAPATLLPGGPERTAQWMLGELANAIKLGTAKKRG
ncbi:hypothetical protein J6500_22150 [Bradyrhizobium sp. WSM 1704]|uniref:hypothetical protein n=1 Tax=Bradyrhizobium semiaridum TaxID=2821404 RepID=UPI001CE25A55|nr:hypothetical protein [Bradyrhizobium semiaridum]MCA6124574.1 hypothetical protein [Bradyrhizobium semiaridum]